MTPERNHSCMKKTGCWPMQGGGGGAVDTDLCVEAEEADWNRGVSR